ncbi:MAG: acyl carrier protein [Rhodospirillaceae bacterium]|nr:acyl carrier protein [Rhodospirillaceae bacterium]
MTDTTTAARRMLAEALELDPAQLPDDASVVTMREWDSLAHMRLVEVIERELAAELPADLLLSIGSLDDVARVLAAQKNG